MEKTREIAVVVTDQRMPKMTGDELVSRINTSYTAQRIMVTGYADLSAVVRAVNEGRIFAYVTKPWNEEDLRLKVAKAAEQFRLGQELAKEKKLLDDLMNYSPDGVYFKNRELQFLRVNRVAASWMRQDVNSLVGKRLRELQPRAEHSEEIEREEQKAIDTGTPLLDVTRHHETEEGGRWISERKAPVFAPNGKVMGLVTISRDITKQYELEEQLLHSQKMEAVGRLAGGVAHDFNNLLAVIQSYAGLVLEGLPEGSRSRDDMRELYSATERAKALTSQLLTFSRRRPVVAEDVDLNQVVRDVEKMVSRLVSQSISVVTKVTDDLPPLRGDMNQLEQVLLNLAINARDAMPGGGTLEIATSEEKMAFADSQEKSSFLCLSVRDTGTGMPPEVQKRIFEPFYSTKEVGKGTGLGLSTVYGIVRQWDGQVRVESQVGTGTCFKVYFPVANDLAAITTNVRFPDVTAKTKGGETILLVEDNESVRTVAARILREEGYHVLEARLPSEAREKYAQALTPIHLLLSDINMPEASGPELARELASVAPDLRILFMSGYSEKRHGDSAPQIIGAHYLEKPFSPESLARAVRNALREPANSANS
jgi:PAS domain S-box-containing protein